MKYCALISMLCILTLHSAMAQWEPDQRLTNDPASSMTAENSNTWTVAAAGDTVHVVWTDSRDGNDEIYYKRSTDGGTTWGGDVKLSTTGLAFGPSAAVAGETVHVVWNGLPSVNPGEPLEVYYTRSTDGGATWDSIMRLTSDSADYAWQPAVAAAGANVHVAWYDGRNGPAYPAEIYYTRSTDGGATWGSDVRLTNSAPASEWASIAATGDRVHVVWSDTRDAGTNEIYYKCSDDNGATWPASPGGDTRLTSPDSEPSCFPSIAVAGASVHVVWCDRRDGASGDEVYYKCSDDGGTTWSNDTRLSVNDNQQSRHPSIAVADPGLHVAWYDNRDGNDEIYYKRNPTGNVGTMETMNDERGTMNVGPTIVHGVLFLPPPTFTLHSSLFSLSGEKVLDLHAGANDVRALAPGVYFARAASIVRKVVLAR